LEDNFTVGIQAAGIVIDDLRYGHRSN